MDEGKGILRKNIYSATKWSVITNIMRKIVTPLTNMVLARLLTPEIFGVVATINIVISFADIFTDAGFQKYLIQHEFKDKNELYKSANVSFWTNFVLSIIIWLIIFIIKDSLAIIVGSEGHGIELSVAAISIPLLSFSSIQQAIFKRNFDFKGMFSARMINSLIPLFVTIPIAYFTKNCWSLIIGTLVSNLSDAVILTLKSKWRPKFYYNIKMLKDMFSFSVWTLLEQLSIWLTVNIDIFILGKAISDYNLGLYKASITSVSQITTLITTTIIPVLFSALSRCQNNERDFKETFYEFQCKCAIILVPMSIGIFIYSNVVTWVLLGNQWMKAEDFIGKLGLIQVLIVLYANFASEVYRSKGEPKISFLVQIIYVCIFVPIILLGIRWNFEILCDLKVLSLLIFVTINVIILKIRYKFSIKYMINNIKEPLIASFIMGSVGFFMNSIINSMIIKMFTIFGCIIVYFICCMCLPKSKQNIISFVNTIKNNKKIMTNEK